MLCNQAYCTNTPSVTPGPRNCARFKADKILSSRQRVRCCLTVRHACFRSKASPSRPNSRERSCISAIVTNPVSSAKSDRLWASSVSTSQTFALGRREATRGAEAVALVRLEGEVSPTVLVGRLFPPRANWSRRPQANRRCLQLSFFLACLGNRYLLPQKYI